MIKTQRFWKISVGKKRPWNDIVIKNKIAVMWGWYGVINFDMKKLDEDGTRETFEKKIKEKFEGSGKRGSKPLTNFYFLQEKDIIFLYGKKLFTVDAIGCVARSRRERPYYYDTKKYRKVFPEDSISDAKASHLVNVNWFYRDLKDPIEIRDKELKSKISRNATIIELKPFEAYTIMGIAKIKHPEIDFSKYIKISKEEEVYAKPIEKDSEESIDKRLGKIETNDMEVMEGKKELREVIWRSRNRPLISRKKSGSDYTCEACGFNFQKKYDDIGREYILAHHKKPLKGREKPEKTRLSDISLVCDNCHRMLHKNDPPYTLKELRKKIQG